MMEFPGADWTVGEVESGRAFTQLRATGQEWRQRSALSTWDVDLQLRTPRVRKILMRAGAANSLLAAVVRGLPRRKFAALRRAFDLRWACEPGVPRYRPFAPGPALPALSECGHALVRAWRWSLWRAPHPREDRAR